MFTSIEFANELSTRWAEGIWPIVWQSAILAAAIFLLTRQLVKAPAIRFWLWMLVPLRMLVMPILTITIPVLPSAPPEEFLSIGNALPAPMEESLQDTSFGAVASLPTGPAFESPQTETPKLGVLSWLMALWGVGFAFSLLRMLNGWRRMRGILCRGTRANDGHILDVATRVGGTIGLSAIPRIVITDENVSPFVLGVLRPAVVLPKRLVSQVSSEKLSAVLAHEFAHLRRKDPLLGCVLAFWEAIYFFHPIVYLAKRALLFEREKACDDWALTYTKTKPSAYASALVASAQLCGRADARIPFAGIVAESFTDLKRRLLAIGSEWKPRARVSWWVYVSMALLGVISAPRIVLSSVKSDPASPTSIIEISEEAEISPQKEPDPPPRTLVASVPANEQESDNIRILHFPEDRSLGSLSVLIRPARVTYRLGRENEADVWEYVAQAQGDVAVPADKPVRLYISGPTALRDLSPLSNLGPNDLHTLTFDIYSESARNAVLDHDEGIMRHLQGLKGLKVLEPYGVRITGKGLSYIKDFRSLNELHLGSDILRNDDLVHLEGLSSLEALHLIVPITDEGLSHLTGLTSLRELSLLCTYINGPGLAYLAQLPSLRFLELRGSGAPSDAFRSRSLRYLENVTSLRGLMLFSFSNITDAAMPHLAKLTWLEELTFLWITGITDTGMPYMKQLTSLKKLNLQNINVTDRGLAHLRALKSLEDLTLSMPKGAGNPRYPRRLTDNALAYVSELPRLKRLNARGWHPAGPTVQGPFTDEGLKHLTKLSRLEELNIDSGAGITDEGLSHLAGLPRLKKLLLSSNGVTNEGLRNLAKAKSLTRLNLYVPLVTVSGVNHLNALTNLTNLNLYSAIQDNARLDLSALTNLESLSIILRRPHPNYRELAFRDEDLAFLHNLPRLTFLQFGLNSSQFTDEGMAHLAELKNLERLFVGGDGLTDEGLVYLEDKRKLYQLNLRGKITDEGLRHLEGLKAMRHLDINSELGLSAQAVNRLQSQLPNLVSFNAPRGGGGAFGG